MWPCALADCDGQFVNNPPKVKDVCFSGDYDQSVAMTALWFQSRMPLTFSPSLCQFAEGQVNKSVASYAKIITQRSNCATLAHLQKDRYRHVYMYIPIYMHVYMPVINLMVTLEIYTVCHWFVYLCVYLCLPGANMTVTQFTASSLAAAWFNFSDAKNRLLQVSSTPKQTPTHFHNDNMGSESQSDQPELVPQKRPELTE